MKRFLSFALSLVALSAIDTPSQASDHVDGIKTAIDNAGDLTDLFTFVSPQNPAKLVLIMNVHVLANSRSRFSDAVDYMFRIRPIESAKTLTASQDPAKERTVVCRFSGGTLIIDPSQHATCTFNLGGAPETVSFDTRGRDFKAGGSGEKGGLKVFAGVRSDPWFLDFARTVKFVNAKPVDQTPGLNGLHGQNILSIVVEVDKQRLGGPMLAVTGQTVRK